ncbi:MAG: hypothetical protein ACRD3T_16915 [Terriglobia bacterium]
MKRRPAENDRRTAPAKLRANTVVIGGHTRNIGKTALMAGLIRALQPLNWTAVKITQFGHGVCSHDGHHCECAPRRHAFEISEELDASGRGDTCRFLAAGAARSLWLRVRSGQLGDAVPALFRALEDSPNVLLESNSIVQFFKPSLFLMVLDSTQADFKASAEKALRQADALVFVGRNLSWETWPELDVHGVGTRPVFRMDLAAGPGPELCEFVLQKITPTQQTAITTQQVHIQRDK